MIPYKPHDLEALVASVELKKKRKPLTEEEINKKMAEYFLENDTQFRFGFMEGVLWAEEHHGISGKEDENTTPT